MEKSNIKEDKVKAQEIRNIVTNHLRRGCRLRLKSNLTKKERISLHQQKRNKHRLVVPADKGRAVDVESELSYLQKEQDQLNEGTYKINKRSKEALVKSLNDKLKKVLKKMGITKIADQRKYLVQSQLSHLQAYVEKSTRKVAQEDLS